MAKYVKDLFTLLPELDVPAGLKSKLDLVINLRAERSAKRKLYAGFSFVTISLLGLIPSFSYLFDSVSQSGFFQYWSLVFTDSTSLSYSLLLSLVETIPLFGLLFFFGAVFALLWSFRLISKNIGFSHYSYKY